jgi:hypothetical protein
MPKVYDEDFTHVIDQEFRKRVLRWAKLCFSSLPRKLKNRANALMILTPIYILWGIYVVSEYLTVNMARTLVLDINNPTLIGMFTSHYLHSLASMDHIISTSIMYIVITIGIIALNTRKKPIYYVTAAIFFLALPFTISSLNLLFLQYFTGTTVIGFSAIDCAFFGYLAYLIIITMWDFAITYNYGKYEAVPWFYINKFLMGTIAIVIIPIVYYIIETVALNPYANGIGHVSGYIYGLIIPQLVGIMIGTKDPRWKIFSAITLILLLATPVAFAAAKYL